MYIIKFIVTKFFAGVLYGFGFLLGVFLIGMVIMPVVENHIAASNEGTKDIFRRYTEDSGLRAEVEREVKNDNEFTLLGRVYNDGDQAWGGVHLQVNFYDSEDNFIDQCEEYLSGELAAGKFINFKADCGSSCKKKDFSGVNRYELLIVDASAF